MRKRKSYKWYIKGWKNYRARQKDVKVVDSTVVLTKINTHLYRYTNRYGLYDEMSGRADGR